MSYTVPGFDWPLTPKYKNGQRFELKPVDLIPRNYNSALIMFDKIQIIETIEKADSHPSYKVRTVGGSEGTFGEIILTDYYYNLDEFHPANRLQTIMEC